MSEAPSFVANTAQSPFARLKPVAVRDVQLKGGFWGAHLKSLRQATLPAQLEQCERTGRIDNFRWAGGKRSGPHQGYVYNDSDVYKWLEAVAWAGVSDPSLSSLAEPVIQAILSAQEPDGYLNTAFMFEKAASRWQNMRDWHELYCAGHFIQAALAHERVFSDDRLLSAATKLADLIIERFRPSDQGWPPAVPGHQGIEIALVELYRATRSEKYLRQAAAFLDARGQGLIGGQVYHQDHIPFRELARMQGHAVRALYLNIAAADIYAETGDPALLEALERLWEHMTTRQMYISGGLGARHGGESFGEDYELPNRRAYAETCAAVASVMWNWRMLSLAGEARYADALELALFNAALVGISLDGKAYFYHNVLADEGGHRRAPWFSCACCPPNIARLLASLQGYFYSQSDEAVWVHLYAESEARIPRPGGGQVKLRQATRYPWEGQVRIEVQTSGEFTLKLRVPGWCRDAQLKVNGRKSPLQLSPGSYAGVRRRWQAGDTLELQLPMPPRFMRSHPAVAENSGRVALARGPLVYCLEGADHAGIHPDQIYVQTGSTPVVEYRRELLEGVCVLQCPAEMRPPNPAWEGALYRPDPGAVPPGRPITATAIPYFAWANRSPGPMRVWLREAV